MKAKCIKVVYEQGGYYTSQGVKNGSKVKKNGGYTQFPQGNGWAMNIKSSKLILYIDVNGEVYATWIDQFFKDNVGRLSAPRRTKIIDTMPSCVEVKQYQRVDGSIYYVVDEHDLEDWQYRADIKKTE